MSVRKPREKSFSTKEAMIKWLNLKRIEILDIHSLKQRKITVIYRDVE